MQAPVQKGKLPTDFLTIHSPFVLIGPCFFLTMRHAHSTYSTSQRSKNRQGSEELAGVSLRLFKITLGKLALGIGPQGRTPVPARASSQGWNHCLSLAEEINPRITP